MDRSKSEEAEAWAGAPNKTWSAGDQGNRFWRYYLGYGRSTTYEFAQFREGWFLEGFSTNSRRFHTRHGTRPGMSYRAARHREKYARRVDAGCYGPLLFYSGKGRFGVQLEFPRNRQEVECGLFTATGRTHSAAAS